jgi:hypothetical protein
MRRARRHPGRESALPAFWWTLAVVHLLPAVRVASALGDAPLEAAATLAILLGVIAYCVLAARVTGRGRRDTRWSGTIAFILAAVVAHHDAVGGLPPAELPAPVVPVLLIAAAGSRRLRRLAATAAGTLHDLLRAQAARAIDPRRAAATLVMGDDGRVLVPALAGPTARGPPA